MVEHRNLINGPWASLSTPIDCVDSRVIDQPTQVIAHPTSAGLAAWIGTSAKPGGGGSKKLTSRRWEPVAIDRRDSNQQTDRH